MTVSTGCSRKEPAPPAELPAVAPVTVVIPTTVLVDDEEVNQFVRRAIEVCTRADYEQFLSLWAGKGPMFTRDQYDQGWRTARKIAVREIQPMRRPTDGSLLYYVHAHMELAPEIRERTREVVLLVVKQNDQWRLARAPKGLVQQVLEASADDDDS